MVLGQSASSIVSRSRSCCGASRRSPWPPLPPGWRPASRRGASRTVSILVAAGQRSGSAHQPAGCARRNNPLRRSPRRSNSTTAIDFTQSSSAKPTPKPEKALPHGSDYAKPAGSLLLPVPPPSQQALRSLFVASAIPMVGFGFMDNLVLIQAGQFIDSTLGVTLGLATMTAAAAGQVVSDVSGVVFGGTLERFLLQLSLIESPNLTSAQRRLSVCRNVSMAGAVCGVIVGCALGATTLLLVDLEKRHRIERAQQIQVIVGDMIALEGEPDEDDAGSSPQPESCNIYVTNADDFQIESDPERPRGRISLNLLSSSPGSASPALVRQCAAQGKALLSQDRSVLCVPVREDDQVLAVLELIKGTPAAQPPRLPEEGRSADGSGSSQTATRGFTDSDVRTAKVMARHLAIFMNRLVE